MLGGLWGRFWSVSVEKIVTCIQIYDFIFVFIITRKEREKASLVFRKET